MLFYHKLKHNETITCTSTDFFQVATSRNESFRSRVDDVITVFAVFTSGLLLLFIDES